MPKSDSPRTHIVSPLATRSLGLVLASASMLAGCLDRPVAPAKPTTTNLYVHAIRNRVVDKLDLLFMIDNSMSMSDKQQILADAMPVLVQRLVNPSCIDGDGKPTGDIADATGHCSTGHPELTPIRDIHVGVITSSLGDRGGTECTAMADDATTGRTPDDRAELLPTANPAVRGPLASWNSSGFLAWDPTQTKNVPPGESDVARLLQNFGDQVKAAGEHGCGYEGSLESWYRFLVDPEPPLNVTTVEIGSVKSNQKGPINEALLAQRKAFLRHDSLLAIVMLTDENDCSLNDDDGAQAWLATDRKWQMPRASAACALDPNDKCCHTCGVTAPDGCTPNEADAECSKSTTSIPRLSTAEDSRNLRCFDQKRRFGLDLMYPVERYVRGLTEETVPGRDGASVPNPIFAAPPGEPARDKSLVLLAGIVGVPWQDISKPEDRDGDGLTYLTAKELREQNRWSLILGDDKGNGPTDPLMRESIAPRSGTNPVLGTSPVPPNATVGQENPVNGNEQNVIEQDDLQYACTFDLPTPRRCGDDNSGSCDCMARTQDYDSPLCEYPDGPGTDGIQVAAKAYPGLRELEVLRGLEDNGIVASICAKHTAPAPGLTMHNDPSYGYNPAMAAFASIVTDRVTRECLPRPLPVETDPTRAGYGQVPCAVVEAVKPKAQGCACDENEGREALTGDDLKLRSAVEEELRTVKACDGRTGVSCHGMCLCKVKSLSGPELDACQAGTEDASTYGYCYIDPAQGIGDPKLIADCGSTMQRSLRLVGDGLPASGSYTFMACMGATLSGSDANAN